MLTWLVACALWSPLGACQASREARSWRILCEVKDSDGKACPDAEVSLLSVPMASAPSWSVDRLAVRTDAEGRARALVLPGRGYHAWAEKAVTNGVRFSEPRAVWPGQPASFVLQPPRRPRRVHVTGLDAWKLAAPAQVHAEAIGTIALLRRELAVDDNGDATCPPLPGDSIRVTVQSGGQELGECWSRAPADGDLLLAVAAPVRLRVRVEDRRTGKPVADSVVRTFLGAALGTTGADGVLEVQVPGPRRPRDAARNAHPDRCAEPRDRRAEPGWSAGS